KNLMLEQTLKISKPFLYQMEDWTEKYRPRTLEEVVGNREAKTLLRSWASQWNLGTPPKKRAVILAGKPGVGKTSSALALANEYNWTVIELNASDVRSADKIKKVATFGALNETFTDDGRFAPAKKGGRKLIILDEADNLYERRSSTDSSDVNGMLDRGGKKAIVDTVKETKQPIILIVNDLYELTRGGGETLHDLCLTIRFNEKLVSTNDIVALLRRICGSEGVYVENEVLVTLAERCKGDVRSAVRDLQAVCLGRKRVNRSVLPLLSYRDREQTIFDVLNTVFKTKNTQYISRLLSQSGEDPKSLIQWVDENLPRAYLDVVDLAKAYEILASADVFLGRASRYRAYVLWRYAVDLMGGGVASAKKRVYISTSRYQFPSWLKEMKTSKSLRDIRSSIAGKIGCYCHVSSKKANQMFNELQMIFQSNPEFALTFKETLGLTEDEMKYLLGDKYKYKKPTGVSKKEDVIEEYDVSHDETEKKEQTEQLTLF
ncbi:MAG: replication factor C large subunit, partial [Thermoplasmata archaeon]